MRGVKTVGGGSHDTLKMQRIVTVSVVGVVLASVVVFAVWYLLSSRRKSRKAADDAALAERQQQLAINDQQQNERSRHNVRQDQDEDDYADGNNHYPNLIPVVNTRSALVPMDNMPFINNIMQERDITPEMLATPAPAQDYVSAVRPKEIPRVQNVDGKTSSVASMMSTLLKSQIADDQCDN